MSIYLKDIIQIVEETPNDFDLGKKIRSYVNESSKPKVKSKVKSKVKCENSKYD